MDGVFSEGRDQDGLAAPGCIVPKTAHPMAPLIRNRRKMLLTQSSYKSLADAHKSNFANP
jgi:hypothetical protein